MPTQTDVNERDLERLFTQGPLHKPDDVVGFWVWRLSLSYQRRAEAALKTLGLTHLQMVILTLSAWLNHTRKRASQRDLADISGVQEAQVSLMVKALKQKKLLSQRPSTEDTRVRLIIVTSAGTKLLSEAIPLMSSLQAELWPPGPHTQQLVTLIEETLRRWDQQGEQPGSSS